MWSRLFFGNVLGEMSIVWVFVGSFVQFIAESDTLGNLIHAVVAIKSAVQD